MAKLAEILSIERQRETSTDRRKLHLFADGSFYRAYNWSAWLSCMYIKQYKVTKRLNKTEDTEVLFIGFPQTSLKNFVPAQCEVSKQQDGHLTIDLPETMVKESQNTQEEYNKWKDVIPTAEINKNKSQPALADRPVSMTGVMKKVMNYNVLEHSPIECMQFITDIQRQLVEIL